MTYVIFEKADFRRVIDDLCRDRLVIAPSRLPGNEFLYRYVRDGADVCLEAPGVPTMSAKEFFFQSEEDLFGFDYDKAQELEVLPPAEPTPRIFLGIRSCDIKGVRFIERFFASAPSDSTVTTKIDNTIFLSLGCVEPTDTCFCICCDGGPFLTDGTDVQLVELGDKYLCEIFTDRGEELLSHYSSCYQSASDSDLARADNLKLLVKDKFKQRSYMATAVKRISANVVPQQLLEMFGNRCMGCGSCSYVCPTCTCFDVVDKRRGDLGARVRTWDSCSYSGFTREVSGHNPRAFSHDRLKRRFFHKLSYQCLLSNGRIGCVGCGRCVVSCPSHIDMSTFVTTLRRFHNGVRDE